MRVFLAVLAMLLILVIGFSTWIATRTIGKVEAIQQASDALELRSFRFGSRLRSQVYRLSSTMLRYEVTGVAAYQEAFENHKSELVNYIEEQSPLMTTEEEQALIRQIQNQLDIYFRDAEGMLKNKRDPEGAVEQFERIKAQLDAVVELTYRLADSRRAEFRELLADYRTASRSLERYIFMAIGVLGIAAAVIAWLTFVAYVRPVRIALSRAKILAEQRKNLADVGALAAGIAHEIRNPITGIRARCFALEAMLGPDSPAAHQISVIDDELTRMDGIVTAFLSFARPAEPNLCEEELVPLFEKIHASLLGEAAQRGVDLVLSLSVDGQRSAIAMVDSDLFGQAVYNLFRNAAEACPKRSGEVTMALEIQAEDHSAIITISDNGSGIAASHVDQIFEPFFSKKPQGTGLGLSITRDIVKKHGGEISVQSDGHGTHFKIVVPILQKRF